MNDGAANAEQQVRWETEQRPRAGLASVLTALGFLAGAVIQLATTQNQPTVGVVQALSPALAGRASTPVDARAAKIAFIDHHAAGLIVGGLVSALGFAALVWVLTFLYRATAARKPDLPAAARPLAWAGPASLALVTVAQPVVLAFSTHHFVHSADKSHDAADAALLTSGSAIAIATLGLAAGFAVGFAFVIVCLNAMRVGLLTRFMGVLGIITGVLFALPIFGSAVPVVQIFWLGALAVLFFGRWPNGVPPAWGTGTAQPWPSQQEMREARARVAATRSGRGRESQDGAGEPEPAPEPAPATPRHSSSKKRKRKRRR